MKRGFQQGVVFYLVITSMAATMVIITLALQGFAAKADSVGEQTDRVLLDAKRLVIDHLVNADLDGGTRRLGEFRLFADLPIAPGTGLDASEPNYDGFAETTGCATSTWLPGQALVPVATSAADARCFGRLAWRSLGLSLPEAGNDLDAWIPWMVVSPNLAASLACAPDLHPSVLGQPFLGHTCTGPLPYPWISVVDERGNLISDRIAIALILPGTALPGQVRSAAAGPAHYLDSVTVNGGCTAPCQAGTYNNANYSYPNNTAAVLMQTRQTVVAAERKAIYQLPYNFNDRLITISVDELMAALERRAKREITQQLQAFRTARGYFPFAAAINDPSGACVAGLRTGRIPTAQGSCNAGEFISLPAWLSASGWQRYFVYSASGRCVAGNSPCNAPGLTVGANTAVNALLIAPGSPITTAPFVPARANVQQPLTSFVWSANLADYLDAVENAAGTADVFEATLNVAGPNNDKLEVIN
jgi:hypothetical protein